MNGTAAQSTIRLISLVVPLLFVLSDQRIIADPEANQPTNVTAAQTQSTGVPKASVSGAADTLPAAPSLKPVFPTVVYTSNGAYIDDGTGNRVPLLSGESLHNPTDQSPSEFPLPPPLFVLPGLELRESIDERYRNSDTGRKHGLYTNAAEIDLSKEVLSKGVFEGDVVLQLIGEQPPDLRNSDDLQIGQAYVQYRLPIETDTDSTVFFRVGQFQIPFGLLATYDPHRLIQQPLYAESLGLRTDWGIGVSGRFYGLLNYDLSVTAGSGPDHVQINPRKVTCFRLGRTFLTRNGMVNVAGSLLTGHLPDTEIDGANPFAVELPASGRIRANRGQGYVDKTRIAVDGTFIFKGATVRGEAVTGTDNNHRVFGLYTDSEYKFSRRAGVIGSLSYWRYPLGNSSSSDASFGFSYAPGRNTTIRLLNEYLRDVPRDLPGQVRHRLTLQTLVRF